VILPLQSANLEVDIPWDYEQIQADSERIKNYQEQKIIEVEFLEPAEWEAWFLFYLAQLHDYKSTRKAMKYECMVEANPLLPKRPSPQRLMAHKFVTLYPLVHPDFNKYTITNQEVYGVFIVTALVVNHNYNTLKKVKKYPNKCPRVGTL
jgi:hypothetical protein